MGSTSYRWFAVCLVLFMAVSMVFLPQLAQAAGNTDSNVCTSFSEMAQKQFNTNPPPPPGIMTNVTNYIKETISDATQNLYNAFIGNTEYQNVVNAAMILMVIFFAVAFLMGIIHATFAECLKRLIKMGLIWSCISADGWDFFSQYVVNFFNNGTDEIIGEVMYISTGVAYDPNDPNSTPFVSLDAITGFVLQPDTLVKILGSIFAGGPYGFAMGGLLSVAVFGLLKLIIDALKSYGVSYVVRSLLLGVAPIFIPFLLFDRTRQLFIGWLNALLNLALQPILYFTFLSFFIVMLSSASQNMLHGELCWTAFKNVTGATNSLAFWRAVDDSDPNKPSLVTGDIDWKGAVSCELNPPAGGCKEFPINIVDLLSFLLLVYIASQFGGIVDNISGEISNQYVNLDKGAQMQMQMMQQGGPGGGLNQNEGGAQNRPPSPKPPPLGTQR